MFAQQRHAIGKLYHRNGAHTDAKGRKYSNVYSESKVQELTKKYGGTFVKNAEYKPAPVVNHFDHSSAVHNKVKEIVHNKPHLDATYHSDGSASIRATSHDNIPADQHADIAGFKLKNSPRFNRDTDHEGYEHSKDGNLKYKITHDHEYDMSHIHVKPTAAVPAKVNHVKTSLHETGEYKDHHPLHKIAKHLAKIWNSAKSLHVHYHGNGNATLNTKTSGNIASHKTTKWIHEHLGSEYKDEAHSVKHTNNGIKVVTKKSDDGKQHSTQLQPQS